MLLEAANTFCACLHKFRQAVFLQAELDPSFSCPVGDWLKSSDGEFPSSNVFQKSSNALENASNWESNKQFFVCVCVFF